MIAGAEAHAAHDGPAIMVPNAVPGPHRSAVAGGTIAPAVDAVSDAESQTMGPDGALGVSSAGTRNRAQRADVATTGEPQAGTPVDATTADAPVQSPTWPHPSLRPAEMDRPRRGRRGRSVVLSASGSDSEASGVWFGLQKNPGSATCGSARPAATSWPYDCACVSVGPSPSSLSLRPGEGAPRLPLVLIDVLAASCDLPGECGTGTQAQDDDGDRDCDPKSLDEPIHHQRGYLHPEKGRSRHWPRHDCGATVHWDAVPWNSPRGSRHPPWSA